MTIPRPSESSKLSPETLSDRALLCEFGELVQQDRHLTANLLRHIDVIDRRKLWAKQGHGSMFDFLVSRYHMSESTAGKRIGAARTARRFPVLFGMVARGEIHLSGIHRLKAHLTHENYAGVLAQAQHKTIRQIEELVARIAPLPDVPSTLRALPQRTDPAAGTSATPTPEKPLSRSPDPAPLSPGRYRLQITLGQAAKDKLNQLQDLLAHQIPNGDPAAIVERALDALLIQVHKRKTGITAKPRAPRPSAKAHPKPATGQRTRWIEVAVRRAVWPRDEARCGFVGEDGRRCGETRGLQFAHVRPWAKGGENTEVNLGLRCMAHNALEADRDFGTSHMARMRERQRSKAHEPLKVREPIAPYLIHRRARSMHTATRIPKCLPVAVGTGLGSWGAGCAPHRCTDPRGQNYGASLASHLRPSWCGPG